MDNVIGTCYIKYYRSPNGNIIFTHKIFLKQPTNLLNNEIVLVCSNAFSAQKFLRKNTNIKSRIVVEA